MAVHEVIILSSSPPGTPSRPTQTLQQDKRKGNVNEIDDDFFDSYSPLDVCSKLSDQRQEGSTNGTLVINSKHREDGFKLSKSVPGFGDSALLNDSIFDDLEFTIEQPSKRRRLSPKPLVTTSTGLSIEADEVFDLSSEPDRAFQKRRISTLRSENVDALAMDDDNDNEYRIEAREGLSLASTSHENCLNEIVTSSDTEFLEILSDGIMVVNDPILTSSQQPTQSQQPKYSAKTAALLENVNYSFKRVASASNPGHVRNASVKSYAKATKSTKSIKAVVEEVDNIIYSSPAKPGSKVLNRTEKPALIEKSTTNLTGLSTQKGTARDGGLSERERKASEREAAKEFKKREKEQKAIDKQRAADIAEANKKKTNKKDSTQEMIIDLPMTVKGKSIGNKVEAKIQELNAEVSYYADEIDMTDDNLKTKNLGSVIKWRRKVTSTYNEIVEEWAPLPRTKIVPENHILVHLPAEDFCLIAAGGCDGEQMDVTDATSPSESMMQENLDAYIVLLRSQNPGCTIIILIEGLSLWLKKSVNAKNREYAAAVRAQPNPIDDMSSAPLAASQTSKPSQKGSKKPKKAPRTELSFIDGDVAESLMLHLQLTHQPLQIHHTIQSESWEQIIAFTQHLSTRPYRNVELEHNLTHASFCMASGQFRTGQGDPLDTWIKMLEQVNRLTVSMAKGIVDEGYESPAQLVKGFEKVETDGSRSGETRQAKERAKTMLEDVKRARSDQRLGPMVSRRLYKIFMSQDEELRDGIA